MVVRKKKNVLLLVESSTAFGRKISQGISHYLREKEHWILHVEDRGLDSVPHRLLKEWKGDGIISRTSVPAMRKSLRYCHCPIVELLSVNSEEMIEVLPDEHKSMEMCIDHFHKQNISAVGFYAYGNNWWVERRHDLFQKIAKTRNLRCFSLVDSRNSQYDSQPLWMEKYEKPLKKWIRSLPHPTGIIAAYDPPAIRVLNACRELGIHVPEQIGILGIDNDDHLCNLVSPQLSSLDRNAEIVGYKAAELLDCKMFRRKLPSLPIVVQPKGVVSRRSSEVTSIADSDIAQALHYIAEFATQNIYVDDIVKHVGISRSTLCRRFQKILQRSPKDEIIRVRLNQAKYLLSQTLLSLRTVAKCSGYKTLEHFTAVFKQHTGMTPLKYRLKSQIPFCEDMDEYET